MADSPRIAVPVSARDHVLGPDSAPVTLLEYGDFECRHCGRAFPTLLELRRRFADRLRFVFRHFPLTNVHPMAQAAAEASEWAAAQGARHFWEMHDRLYRQQGELSDELLLRVARDLELDASSLARTLKEHLFFARVKEDFLGGINSGIKGTPAFFINDVRHQGDVSTLAEAIEEVLRG